METRPQVVTGAFGFSGKYIARRLLDAGHEVSTLTNSPDRPNPFGSRVRAHPLNFDKPDELAKSLDGACVLYNTYWVRFGRKGFSLAQAERNTKVLFDAARKAGVERIVHVSILNPSADSRIEYFRRKWELEAALQSSGLSHAILRPAILFGEEDILVNNIAWALRKSPILAMFGKGDYRIRPIYVDDLAALAVEQGNSREDSVIDAVGPETFTYHELVKTIARGIGKRRLLVPMPAPLAYLGAVVTGWLLGDVMLTRDEIDALMAGLLSTDSPPAGHTALSEWTRQNGATLGRRYASELARRKDRTRPYV